MDSIQKLYPLDFNSIDKQNYTVDLLNLCSVNNTIGDSKIREIRQCLDETFKEYAEQYTKRESSTISKKCAEQIYSSVLYQSDVYLLSLNSNEIAIKEINENTFKTILEKGQQLILDIHNDNFKVFRIAYKKKLNIPLYEYQYVMTKSFDEYVQNYSARFDARNCCASIDYPLLGCPAYNIKSQGAMFIHEYYTGIMFENIFCSYFDESDIEKLLISYGNIYKCKYNQMLLNISEIVLNNLLFTTLINKEPLDLNVSKDDLQIVNDKYYLSSKEELESNLLELFSVYKSVFHSELYSYLNHYIPTFAEELYMHLKNNTLSNFIVVNDM